MEHSLVIQNLPLHAVGCLDRPDRREIDQHLLAGCATCHAELKEFQSVAALLPYTLTPTGVPRTLKARILAARQTPVVAPEVLKRPNQPSLEPGEWMKHLFPPTPRFSTMAIPAIGILAVVFGAAFLYMGYAAYVKTVAEAPVAASLREESHQAREQVAQLEAQVRKQESAIVEATIAVDARESVAQELRERLILREAELDDVRNQLAEREKDSTWLRHARAQADEVAGLFRSPTARTVPVTGLESAQAATGLALYDRTSGKAFLFVYNLAAAPAGQAYSVWAVDQQPKSVGALRPDASQKASLSVKGLASSASITKFIVTLEPERGSQQPTGPVLLSASL
ncbi:MAG: anti-sigma factor [Nitrospiraceae bacterium]